MASLARPVLLIPVDDRPASTQFAQMIGAIGSVQVETPPPDLLGRFLTPGKPDLILKWLATRDLSKYSALIVSTDMLAYGGLIASRVPATTYRTAIERLRGLQRIVRPQKNLPVYALSAIMRIHPTATRESAAWRIALASFVVERERYRKTGDPAVKQKLERLRAKVPPQQLQAYEAARTRNLDVQRELVRMANAGVFSYLILGQDDSQPEGPQIADGEKLRAMVEKLKLSSRVSFAEGVDQHSSVLLSRALLRADGWAPRIRLVYADSATSQKVAVYESAPIASNVLSGIVASGARIASPNEPFDYVLYVNTPGRTDDSFKGFYQNLEEDVEHGQPVAVADINLGLSGAADPQLYGELTSERNATRLVAYAGWNTAGNTLGTTLAAANVYLAARRENVAPLKRELAQRAFLLHRLVNDFAYHRFTRPQAYAMLQGSTSASKEEAYGVDLERLDQFVRSDLQQRLETLFKEQLEGRRFYAGARQYVVRQLTGVDVRLPWPRAYEVKISFSLNAEEVRPGE